MRWHKKKWLRRVIKVRASSETTRRGNPRDIIYILECGHVCYEPYSPRSYVHLLCYQVMETQGKTEEFVGLIHKYCIKCFRGKQQPDIELLTLGDAIALQRAGVELNGVVKKPVT